MRKPKRDRSIVGGQRGQFGELKIPGRPCLRKPSTLLWVFPPGPLLGPFRESWKKNPLMLLTRREEKEPPWNASAHSGLNKACPPEKLFYHSLTCWGLNQSLMALGVVKYPALAGSIFPQRGRNRPPLQRPLATLPHFRQKKQNSTEKCGWSSQPRGPGSPKHWHLIVGLQSVPCSSAFLPRCWGPTARSSLHPGRRVFQQKL